VAALFSADISPLADFGLNEFRSERMQTKFSGAFKNIPDKPYIVLLHGTTWNSKYWPETSWMELIRLLTQQGWRGLLPWGNEVERDRAQRLQTAGGEHAQVLPKMSLTEMMDVLLHARAFVSVESGIGHLAAALDISGIMLHGPTDPSYSGILDKACLHITSGIDCSPCFRRDCPKLSNLQKIPPCQQEIAPMQVYRQCIELIASNPQESAV
jgi:heptosyltransferase-1